MRKTIYFNPEGDDAGGGDAAAPEKKYVPAAELMSSLFAENENDEGDEGGGEGAAAGSAAPAKKKDEAGAGGAAPDFSSALTERYQGKIKSFEDIDNIVKEREEFSKRLDLSKYPDLLEEALYLEKGGDRKAFEKLKKIGKLDEMDHATAVKTIMELEFSDLTPDEIQKQMNRKYPPKPVLPEDATEEEEEEYQKALGKYQDAQLDLKMDGKLAKDRLSNLYKELEVPESYRTQQSQVNTAKEAQQNWEKAVDSILSGLEKTEFTFPKSVGGKYAHEMDADRKAEIKSIMNNLKDAELWGKVAIGADGKFDGGRLAQTIELITNPALFDKIVENAYNRGKKALAAEVKGTQSYEDNSANGGGGEGSENTGDSMLKAMPPSRP